MWTPDFDPVQSTTPTLQLLYACITRLLRLPDPGRRGTPNAFRPFFDIL